MFRCHDFLFQTVKLRETGSADEPFTVDSTPPVAGVVNDGNIKGRDIIFQSSASEYCANWQDFHDPESGIGEYILNSFSSLQSDWNPFKLGTCIRSLNLSALVPTLDRI